jgi:AcrR family transcriptional regulator
MDRTLVPVGGNPVSVDPFVFHGCVDLKELLPFEARDVRELLEHVGRVPVESLFCHTAAALLHRSALPTAYPNDFAHWTGLEMRDQRLAERLAAIDPFESRSLEQMREEMVATISDHLQHFPPPTPGLRAEPFRFFQAHLVPVPTGHQARTLKEFRDALAEVDVSALFYHLIEARYRLSRGRGDFAEWVASALDRPDVAERLASIDPYGGSLERIRDRHLTVLTAAMDGEPR